MIKNPCECCTTDNYDKRCDSCVFYSFLVTDYCQNIECEYHLDDNCLLGIDPTKCGASGVFEFDDEEEIENDED